MKHERFARLTTKKIISITIGLPIIVAVGLWAFLSFTPKSLGDKLEYLGKEDLGGGLFFSDSKPYSVYYYGTDMSKEELEKYFSHGKHRSISNSSGGGARYSFQDLYFSSKEGEFTISLYNNKDDITENASITKTNKRYVISILNSDYEAVKAAL